ncbi:MAG: hypothetical protein K8F30_00365 [Taibaiella sp.]|nr:hypothetical protein [Taibaiella sp.]
MIQRILLFMVCVLSVIQQCYAQLTVCKVRGTVQYNDNGTWKNLNSPSQKIADNTILYFGANSSCVVVKDKGESSRHYATAKATQMRISSASFEEESILDKIWAAISGLESDPSKPGGATIFRGESLMLLPADGEVLLYSEFDYVWRSNNSLSYDFFLQDDETGQWLCNNVKVKDTLLKAQRNAHCNKAIAGGKTYYWGVKPTSNTSEECYLVGFSLATSSVKTALEKKLSELRQDRDLMDEDVYEVLVADAYADKRMYTQAYKTLVTASGRFPESEMIRGALKILRKSLIDLNSETYENSGK